MTISDAQLRDILVHLRLMHSLVTDLIYEHDAAGHDAVLEDLGTVLPVPTAGAVFEGMTRRVLWFEMRPSTVRQSADLAVFWRSASGDHWLGSCDVERVGADPHMQWVAAETAWNLAVYDAFGLPRPSDPGLSE